MRKTRFNSASHLQRFELIAIQNGRFVVCPPVQSISVTRAELQTLYGKRSSIHWIKIMLLENIKKNNMHLFEFPYNTKNFKLILYANARILLYNTCFNWNVWECNNMHVCMYSGAKHQKTCSTQRERITYGSKCMRIECNFNEPIWTETLCLANHEALESMSYRLIIHIHSNRALWTKLQLKLMDARTKQSE